MSPEATAIIGALVGGAGALAATPVAIRVAQRIGFLDRPRGYRAHASATPFLGGAAVIGAFIAASIVLGLIRRDWVLVTCVFALWGIGTADDSSAILPQWRLVAEAAAATALFGAGLGWDLPIAPAANLGLTVAWVIVLVNGFNLMDNQDGACASVAVASSLGIAAIALAHHDAHIAGLACALAAACAGFLRFNLARPARVFLGDGGSMPIGFIVAALGMGASRAVHHGDAALLVIAMAAAVVLLDTTLVIVSRTRRRIPLLTGGRDHLTHRLLTRLGTPQAVALALLAGQGALGVVAVASDQLGAAWVIVTAGALLALGVTAIVTLDTAAWRPAGIASARRRSSDRGASPSSGVVAPTILTPASARESS